jgi:aspartate kinase
MRGVPGVMSRIIRALKVRQIDVLQTSDSHTTISCLVRGEDTISCCIGIT